MSTNKLPEQFLVGQLVSCQRHKKFTCAVIRGYNDGKFLVSEKIDDWDGVIWQVDAVVPLVTTPPNNKCHACTASFHIIDASCCGRGLQPNTCGDITDSYRRIECYLCKRHKPICLNPKADPEVTDYRYREGCRYYREGHTPPCDPVRFMLDPNI